MFTWTCPNTKCTYDRQLQPGQYCPICGKEAKDFKFDDFGTLLKEKNRFKKSTERLKQAKRAFGKIKFCPTCGSTNIFWASGLPQLWSLWECRECGYKGALVLKDGKMAAKLREEWEKKHREQSN